MKRFDWDAANLAHIARHGVSAEEAETVIANNPLELPGDFREGEWRQPHLGITAEGRILIVVTVETRSTIRIVTAWPAKERLRRFWETTRGKDE